MLPLLPSLYFGWGIGANDAANTFGPQVAHEANGVEEPLIRLISVSGDIHVTRH